MLNEDTGWAHFKVKYLALVFRPFKNEVLSAVVTELNENGLHAQAGPQRIYVSKQGMAEDARYDPNSNPPCFVSDLQEYRIKKNSLITLKITGIRLAATEIVS
jgi:DNA-directed RNA polymerase II subunit RPB7